MLESFPRPKDILNKIYQHLDPNPANLTLIQTLHESLKSIDTAPHQSRYWGMPALITSSDKTSADFFEKVQQMNPDGYIVGIGAGGVFALRRCFPPFSNPKAMILSDINPNVVTAGRALIDTLCETNQPSGFADTFFKVSYDEGLNMMKLHRNKDNRLVKGAKRWHNDFQTPQYAWLTSQRRQEDSKTDHTLDIPTLLQEDFYDLRNLALKGLIGIEYTDFMNPHFVEAVRRLPNFSQLINIIYVTNLLNLDNNFPANKYSILKKYDQSEQPPIYIFSNDLCDLQTARSYDELLERAP